MIDGRRIAVLIPARDEEEALPGTLDRIPRPPVDTVVVVDNGSSDRTGAVAREGGARLVREERRGYGAACLAGLDDLAGRGEPPDVVVFVDADHGGEPGALRALVEPVVRGRADLVLASRTPPSGDDRGARLPLHQRWGNRLVLVLVRALFGYRFDDIAPFRAVAWPALRTLAMDDRDWGWTLQMQLRAARRGLRIVEVPVADAGRRAGRSKISGTVGGSLRAGAKMLWTVVRERLTA